MFYVMINYMILFQFFEKLKMLWSYVYNIITLKMCENIYQTFSELPKEHLTKQFILKSLCHLSFDYPEIDEILSIIPNIDEDIIYKICINCYGSCLYFLSKLPLELYTEKLLLLILSDTKNLIINSNPDISISIKDVLSKFSLELRNQYNNEINQILDEEDYLYDISYDVIYQYKINSSKKSWQALTTYCSNSLKKLNK